MRKVSPTGLFYIVLFSFLLVGYTGISGCKNPFKTRNSPPPVISEGTWETPALPEIVIQNLFYAYNEKIIGNFILCLCDSFGFSAPEDSIDAVNDGRYELFARWDRSVEISVTTSIFNKSRQNPDSFDYVVSFLSTHPPDEVGDTLAVLSRDYELFIFDLKAVPPETTLAKGTATFHMRQTSFSWWSIYFWNDIPAEAGKDDWGDFKAQFRQ
ncbi:MAG: hypothetical protein KAW02_03595 [candidate division Zixibacteria bacterium]|nr:hypothetical protein [candidate division Zixibacteria bacterium]